MAARVDIQLTANGQALETTSAPIIASASVGMLHFAVRLSDEWRGFNSVWVVLKNGDKISGCEVVDGVAVADSVPLARGGALECAIVAREGVEQLTTERVIIPLAHSGKERG